MVAICILASVGQAAPEIKAKLDAKIQTPMRLSTAAAGPPGATPDVNQSLAKYGGQLQTASGE
jgi:hypothetical protein